MTVRKQVLQLVEESPGLSATQIAHRLGLHPNGVSALLNQCAKSAVLRRIPGKGPRGGYVYYMMGYVAPKTPYPTRFDRIVFAR